MIVESAYEDAEGGASAPAQDDPDPAVQPKQ